ncbi:MAG: 2-dehydro-3-deoxyphosphooctonate aldolase [Phycisphaeraceae bacterium]|nr:MAG: 2-dehydro-3-deoxyphosphooctonate aldolase [Phycisphaeraceae bacterium]
MTPTTPPPTQPRLCSVGPVEIGPGRPLAVIAGPCTLESFDMGLEIGRTLRDTCAELGLGYVFKASFDKANRTSVTSPRGPGLAEGLDQLGRIRDELGVPVTTDIHDPAQAEPVAAVVDALQIPAFLCRQSDLLAAAAEAANARGIAVNVKKGQFLSPGEMVGPVRKLAESGCENVLLTERGTFFGYHRLVNDFIGLGDMMELDCSAFSDAGSPPVCFDVTHSTQLPGSGTQTGGRPERAPLLARAAVAAGVHAVFIECHPEPSEAWSDGATQLRTEEMAPLLRTLAAVRDSIA